MTAGLDAGAVEAYRRPHRADPAAHAWLRDRVRSLRDVSILPRTAASLRGAPTPNRVRSTAHPAGSDLRARSGRPPLAGLAGTPSTVGGVLSGLGEVRFPLIVSVRLAPELVDGYTAFLNRLTSMRVEAARVGSTLTPGVVRVASADLVVRVDEELRVQQAEAGGQAADELFASIARTAGPKGVGVLLIGMGKDGPAGLRAIRRAGGAALVQDAAATTSSSLPDVRVMPLARIAGALREAVSRAEV
jgi:two-component system chemotaxis response regulator CheB